jgi:polygalacturonase
MLFLENVEHLTITQVTLEKSAFWTVHMVGCRDVLIDGIRILNNMRMANCDGIDPDHCQNVRIANCHIECADDCIVFKNTAAAMQYGPCENITVTGCTMTSYSAAIKFGSESEDLFRNIIIENCVIYDTNRGISLQLRDKGSIENVLFHNITIQTRLRHPEVFWGMAEPIAITVFQRKVDTTVGHVRNIRFSNILCDSENGILLFGEKEGDISNIRFQNVSLQLGSHTGYPQGIYDLRPNTGSSFTPRACCLVRGLNAQHIFFQNCDFSAEEQLDPPYILENCNDFII